MNERKFACHSNIVLRSARIVLIKVDELNHKKKNVSTKIILYFLSVIKKSFNYMTIEQIIEK